MAALWRRHEFDVDSIQEAHFDGFYSTDLTASHEAKLLPAALAGWIWQDGAAPTSIFPPWRRSKWPSISTTQADQGMLPDAMACPLRHACSSPNGRRANRQSTLHALDAARRGDVAIKSGVTSLAAAMKTRHRRGRASSQARPELSVSTAATSVVG